MNLALPLIILIPNLSIQPLLFLLQNPIMTWSPLRGRHALQDRDILPYRVIPYMKCSLVPANNSRWIHISNIVMVNRIRCFTRRPSGQTFLEAFYLHISYLQLLPVLFDIHTIHATRTIYLQHPINSQHRPGVRSLWSVLKARVARTIVPYKEPSSLPSINLSVSSLGNRAFTQITQLGCNYRSAWIRIGMAISIAQSLNLMSEPPNLANSTGEEHRRTLWSLYMLDRLGTCGTNRTGLFPDSALRLRLPCPENTFRDGLPNDSPTLKNLNESPPDQLGNFGALARVILLASTLSCIAGFSLQQSWQTQREPPWTQNSEHAKLITRLNSLSTYFDKRQPFDPTSWSSGGREDSDEIALCIFSHILYHLCYCMLQHPFVLKRRHRPNDAPFPSDFLSDNLQKNWQHAQDLTHTLSYATQKKMPTWSSFYAYCSLVAGTINCLHCLSTEENIQKMSELAVQMNFLFLERQAKLYGNSAQMVGLLMTISSCNPTYTGSLS